MYNVYAIVTILNTLVQSTMPNRGASFRKEELIGFLDVLEQVKPIGGEDWMEVQHFHNINFPAKH
jgi:hypothetical protein